MGAKTFRVTISFDEIKEHDIINQLEKLADKRQLGAVLSNLVRIAVDNKNQDISLMGVSSLSRERQQFFNGVTQHLKEQDHKIDTIYSICEDLYGLARANKALGLESKVDNLMFSQFLLQRQQTKLKELLGESGVQHLYESDKLINEKEKADKVWEYIAEVYGGMIAELRPLIFKEIEIPRERQIETNQKQSLDLSNLGIKADEAKGHVDSEGKYIPSDDDIIDLDDDKDDKTEIQVPTGEAANLLLELMRM